jgi:hypothetical protein
MMTASPNDLLLTRHAKKRLQAILGTITTITTVVIDAELQIMKTLWGRRGKGRRLRAATKA